MHIYISLFHQVTRLKDDGLGSNNSNIDLKTWKYHIYQNQLYLNFIEKFKLVERFSGLLQKFIFIIFFIIT